MSRPPKPQKLSATTDLLSVRLFVAKVTRGAPTRQGARSDGDYEARSGKKSAISLFAESGPSEPWTRLSGILDARSPRIVPGEASDGSVAPMIERTSFHVSGVPSRTIANTGDVVMNLTMSEKKGLSRCSS